ncbi:hypothetical protein ADL04_16655 [Streptomyces sp. NRRL B-3648]|nr:hypothetical protein ADL04_16655 [Streptomyces sp. NRRL B-3648]
MPAGSDGRRARPVRVPRARRDGQPGSVCCRGGPQSLNTCGAGRGGPAAGHGPGPTASPVVRHAHPT